MTRAGVSSTGARDPLRRQIFVVAPPGAGAATLAASLRRVPELRALPGSTAGLIAPVPLLDPGDGSRSGRLIAADCAPEVRARLRAELTRRLRLPRPAGAVDAGHRRLFDASPRNALMVPFLRALFPDASFVYVHRAPRETLTEAAELWRSGEARTYPNLASWRGPPWSFLLVPGWHELRERPLAEIVTEQWVRTMRVLISDLEALPPGSWSVVEHRRLTIDPQREVSRVLAWLGVAPTDRPAAHAPAQPRLAEPRPEWGALGPYLARTLELFARASTWIADASQLT